MVFSSPGFLFLFLPLALAVCLPARGIVYLIALYSSSLFFYFWSSGIEVLILFLVVGTTYYAGIAIDRADLFRQRLLIVFIAIDLSALLYFKYAGFLARNIAALLDIGTIPNFGGAALPIGISFFTFQAISYLVDVYRRDVPAEKVPFAFGAYLTFFPHLIAGPIVRYRDVIEDFRQPKITLANLSAGTVRFAHGLFKKIVIADAIAPIADAVFALPSGEAGFATAWIGAIAFALQIYFDFSAYSDMAIGLALMFGVHFHENFERPYVSRSITEFWRRWHISLSTWFRDYVYIPLGGNRRGPVRTYFNLLVVFLVTGLWHGAAWTFVLWGLFHGAFLIFERLAFGEPVRRLVHPAFRFLYCLPVLIFGWVLFRAEFLTKATDLWWTMLSPFARKGWDLGPVIESLNVATLIAFAVGGTILVLPAKVSIGQRIMREWTAGLPAAAVTAYALAAFAVCMVLVLSGNYSPFLYFRF